MKSYRLPSGMHDFGANPGPKIQRSQFKRPFRHKTSIDSGYIYPVMVDEVLPGDTISVNLASVCRLATPIVPIMDNIYIDWFFFFVPNRLVWDNWTKLMGERVNPDDDIDYLVPQVAAPTTTGFSRSSLYDYMGIKPATDGFSINNLIPRGYNLIWNHWFRSPWLQDEVTVDLDDGPDDPADYVLLRRGKRSDYFTSCLPSPQRDSDPVLMPLGDSAVIERDSTSTNPTLVYSTSGGLKTSVAYTQFGTTATGGLTVAGEAQFDPNGNLVANLSDATAASINDIREAFALQRILEADARGGTRYTEILQNFWGVEPEDSRMQRPEYLGGGSRNIDIQAVPQMSETSTTPQGTLSGIGYNMTSGIGMHKSFSEHGHIFCLVSVRADQTYQDGLRRMWSRRTRYDFPMPQTANLGEMAVLNKEIYLTGTANDELVFGYNPHWDDYRYIPSMVTGKMRSDDPQSLDPWHLAPDFASCPELGADFIEEDPPIDRIVATTNEPQFIVDVYMDIKSGRCLPMFGVPGMLDHF